MSKSTTSTTSHRARAPDPIFAAIAARERLEKIWGDLYSKINLAESKARKKHGPRPSRLIAWRNYSSIGCGEIERARDRFLAEGLNRKMIMKEYQDAKRRERKAKRAETAWDRRAGITEQRRDLDRAIDAEGRAAKRMAGTRPTTPSGAAAMLAYTAADRKAGEGHWHSVATETLIATLSSWGKAVHP